MAARATDARVCVTLTSGGGAGVVERDERVVRRAVLADVEGGGGGGAREDCLRVRRPVGGPTAGAVADAELRVVREGRADIVSEW